MLGLESVRNMLSCVEHRSKSDRVLDKRRLLPKRSRRHVCLSIAESQRTSSILLDAQVKKKKKGNAPVNVLVSGACSCFKMTSLSLVCPVLVLFLT